MSESDDTAPIGAVGLDFAGLSALLLPAEGMPLEPDRVVAVAVRSVALADACGITFLRAGQPLRTLGSTGPLARAVDILQAETGEGPCVSAARGEAAEITGDVAADDRWPVFGPRCRAEAGVASILSVRLALTGGDEAAINFHSRQPDAFGDPDVATASMFAPFAALAVEQALRTQDAANFRVALSSSRQIGTAVGILMATHRVSAETAFERLRAASQQLNRKLRDLAAEVAETGTLPDPPPGRPER